MQFEPALKPARLIQRYKRFLADVITPDGEALTLHCPNTGAMTGCATPRDTVWYSTSDNRKRRYPHSWELTETASGQWIRRNDSLAGGICTSSRRSAIWPREQQDRFVIIGRRSRELLY